jgi:glycosyltransferase involved in cell wall biosynthesis
LAYPFPPLPAIGAVRAWHMAQHLARLGWEVTVVTPSPGEAIDRAAADAAKERCRQEGIKRVFAGKLLWRPRRSPFKQLAAWLRFIPMALLGRVLQLLGIGLDEAWLAPCIRTCLQLNPGDFDVVLATGSPFSTFVAAKTAARRLGAPYVLDYRDTWSLSSLQPRTLARLIRPLERSLLRDAAATLMVSASQAYSQAEVFRMPTPPAVMTNGYDPEQLDAVTPAAFTDFAVVYAGAFYQGQREIDPVLKAVQRAAESRGQDGPPIRLHYYGNDVQHVMERARAYGAEGLVDCYGHVTRAQALAAIKGAGVVAVIAGIRERADLEERGIITGKIFEPLGMGVPVLLVAPEGSDATAIVEKAGAGRSFRASQVEAMAQWLVELASNPSKRRYEPPEAYSWPVLAPQLDYILHQALAKPKN